MKKIVLYMEIQGLWKDENGNPNPAGLKLDFGAEIEDEKYKELMEKATVKLENTLNLMGLQKDCKLISEQEYKEKYGDD